MLSRFSVKNFKGFDKPITLDLTSKTYAFNTESVKDNIINKAIIYGYNGIGKSNLGLALFDIVVHGTDKFRDLGYYQNYLNALSDKDYAEFEYTFLFDGSEIVYSYGKTDVNTMVYEKIVIDEETMLSYNQQEDKKVHLTFEGTESLNTNIDEIKISFVKYMKSNAVLSKDNRKNILLQKMLRFIDDMLLFWSLERRHFQGYEMTPSQSILDEMIKQEHFDDFKTFLGRVGVDNNIKIVSDSMGKKNVVYDFNGRELDFHTNCSSGTRSLVLFYHWLQKIKFEKEKPSLIFIDEFDAFYHQDLSISLVEELKKNDVQVILTTHNTGIMSNKLLRPDCYFLMYKDRIESLAHLTDKELRQAHNIEKMYRAGAFHG